MWTKVFVLIWVSLSMALGGGISVALYRLLFYPRTPGVMGAVASGIMGTMITTALFINLLLLLFHDAFGPPFYVPRFGVAFTFVCAAMGASEVLYFHIVSRRRREKREEQTEQTESEAGGNHH